MAEDLKKEEDKPMEEEELAKRKKRDGPESRNSKEEMTALLALQDRVKVHGHALFDDEPSQLVTFEATEPDLVRLCRLSRGVDDNLALVVLLEKEREDFGRENLAPLLAVDLPRPHVVWGNTRLQNRASPSFLESIEDLRVLLSEAEALQLQAAIAVDPPCSLSVGQWLQNVHLRNLLEPAQLLPDPVDLVCSVSAGNCMRDMENAGEDTGRVRSRSNAQVRKEKQAYRKPSLWAEFLLGCRMLRTAQFHFFLPGADRYSLAAACERYLVTFLVFLW